MIKYKIIKERLNAQESGSYDAYGICAVDSASEKVVEKISDVFLNYENAIHFIDTINAFQLDLTHLHEVVENVLINAGDID